MTFQSMISDPDISRVVLCEMRPKIEIETKIWTPTGAGSCWCDWPYLPVYVVSDDLIDYTRAADVDGCDGAASSFFHDSDNKKLYVHSTSGISPDGTSGGEYLSLYFAKVMVAISSGSEYPVIYTPTGMVDEMLYDPYLDTSTAVVSHSVSDYHEGGLSLTYGQLTILNDGTAYEWERDYIWDYADITVKMGETDALYSAFETIFIGQLVNPTINDAAFSLDTVSALIILNEDIVATKFTTTAYVNLDPNANGKPQPWVFGAVIGLIPTCIETLTHIYRIACHALQEVTAVYQDGVLLTPTTDYTLSADNTEITIIADPGDAVISCDVKGAKCNQAQNLIKYSEDYSPATWDGLSDMAGVYYAKPPMTTGIADPYGGTRATEFADLDPWPIPADFVSGIKQTFANSGTTYSVGTTYTVSIWARCVTGTLTVYFGFDSTHNSTFVLTTAWQRLTYTAAYVSGGTNIYIAERTVMTHTHWQIAFPQAVQSSVLTRYTQTSGTIKTTDSYSYLVADILAYLASGNGPISKSFTLDIEAINELYIRRPELLGLQITEVAKGMDVLALLMRTSVFQLTPLLDGTFRPYIYKTTVDDDALRIDGPDMVSFSKYKETVACYKKIICNYNYRQDLGTYLSTETAEYNDNAEKRYGTRDYLSLDLALRYSVHAWVIGDYYVDMYKQPVEKVELTIGASGMNLVPGDQIIINKSVIKV